MKGVLRSLLDKFLLGVVLLALGAISPASAAVGDPVILGQTNDSGNQSTEVVGAAENSALIRVANEGINGVGLDAGGEAIGVRGGSTYGIAVSGFSFYGVGISASSVHGKALGAGSTYGPGLWAGGGSGGVQAESYDTTGAFPAVSARADVSAGIVAVSQIPLFPWSSAPGTGVFGIGPRGGVRGEVWNAAGDVIAEGIGVLGASGVTPTSTGQGIGVRGEGSAIGVHGKSEEGVGVKAESTSGFALEVIGRARFSTAGAGMINRDADSAATSDYNVSENSIILVTLTSNPGNPNSIVQWVERNPGVGFTVHLTKKVGTATTFTYLILEPGP